MGVQNEQVEKAASQAHWDKAYENLSASGVSWYQPQPTLSVDLISTLELPRSTPVIDMGGGASNLAGSLVEMGYLDVTVLDLSSTALDLAKERLGPEAPVQWVHADLLTWEPPRSYGLWHDRAVFHFLTQEHDRSAYLKKLGSAITRPGYVILATFASDGPQRCSGLPVARYSVEDLTGLLSTVMVQVVGGCREDHVTPSGTVQPFSWVVGLAT
jgi:hypothetical protein